MIKLRTAWAYKRGVGLYTRGLIYVVLRYLCWPDSRWLSLSTSVNKAGSFLFTSLKSCVRLSLLSIPLTANPWRARNPIFLALQYFYQVFSFGKTVIVQIIDRHFQYITTLRHYGFICNCSFTCFRLLVINKCFRSFPPIIKPLRDISFLHIMFCCQFPFTFYAKHTKKRVLLFGIVKPGKVLEPIVFSFQIISVEKNNEDLADIVLECFRYFRLWIFPHLCEFFLRFEHRIHFVETKKMFLQ